MHSSLRTPPSRLLRGHIGLLYDATMVGGTALSPESQATEFYLTPFAEDYVTVRVDAILAYERAITELRLQVLHYERIIARLTARPEIKDEYTDVQPVIPLNTTSVRLINSLLQASIPTEASFRDFEEGEL